MAGRKRTPKGDPPGRVRQLKVASETIQKRSKIERQALIVELSRYYERSYRELAAELGVSVHTIASDMREIQERIVPLPHLETIQAFELESLTELSRTWMPLALRPLVDGPEEGSQIYYEPAERAANLVLRISKERRAWSGFDKAPARTDEIPEVNEMGHQEVEAEVYSLLEGIKAKAVGE